MGYEDGKKLKIFTGNAHPKLAKEIAAKFAKRVEYIPKIEEIPERLYHETLPGDLIITMGAGNIYTVAEELATMYSERNGEGAL